MAKLQKNNGLPKGWRWLGDGTPVSPEDLKRNYVLRCYTFPIVSPEDNGKGSAESWKEFRAITRLAFQRSTEAANWAMQLLFSRESLKVPGVAGQRMPKRRYEQLYQARHNSWWAGWSISASAVLRRIEQSWNTIRFRTAWTNDQAVPRVRYPYPYPVHNEAWSLSENENGALMYRANLGSGKISVRLKGGAEFRYMTVRARWLIENPRMRCESAIIERSKVVSGKKEKTQYVKIVGYFPRQERVESSGVMIVQTAPESFLIGFNSNEDRMWVINGDRAKDWITRHAMWMQRWREDQKYEIRRPKRRNRNFKQDMEARCRKNNDRIDSFIKESASQVVEHAKRRRLAEVILDDNCREFLGAGFPYYRFAEQVRHKCEERGVGYRYVGPDKPAKKQA